MLGRFDQPACGEQAPIICQHQPGGQVDARQAPATCLGLSCCHQGACDAAAALSWVDRDTFQIQPVTLALPEHHSGQTAIRQDADGSVAAQYICCLHPQSGCRRVRHYRLCGEGQADQRGGGGGVFRAQRTECVNHDRATVEHPAQHAYLGSMYDPIAPVTRPPVPDIIVPRGVTPFHLPDRPVRGRLVRLGALADALLTRHDNVPAITALTGQALALVAALATALKYRGTFSLQAKGDGPVRMLLADCTDGGALRGYAQADADQLETLLALAPEPSAAQMLGGGYLAFTVDQGPDTERHQGIVTITGDSLSDMARASALILERVAIEGGIDPVGDAAMAEEAWRTATILAETVSDAELLDDTLLAEHLLYRLFHTEGVAADRARPLSYGCRCSRQRLAGILEGFSADDLDHMASDGDIVMTCEFCNFDFRFPRDAVHGGDQ